MLTTLRFHFVATSIFCIKRKYIRPADDDNRYPILAKHPKESLEKPVIERSKKAIAKSWCAKQEFEINNDVRT